MSGENSKFDTEMNVLKEKLDKVKSPNAELTKQNVELSEEIEEMKAEKLQGNTTQSIDSKLNSQQMEKTPEENSTKSKRPKTMGKRMPNWFFDSLPWISRKDMANSSLIYSCKALKQLCLPKPHTVNYLDFHGEHNDETGIYEAKLEKWGYGYLPIAQVPSPSFIIGFNNIIIRFLDGRVMQFIECILPKLNGISLFVRSLPWHSQEHVNPVLPFFEMLAKKAVLMRSYFGNFLRSHPNADAIIENVQLLSTEMYKVDDVDVFIKWLIKSRPDRKPKFLDFFQAENTKFILIDKIKEQFAGSTQSANFLIPHSWGPQYPLFTMENERTGEVLALYPNANQDQWAPRQFLVRHPKGEENFRAEWEKQFKQMEELPKISLKIQKIGRF